MSMKNSKDTIGNRTRELPACSALLQPTAPPRAPYNDNNIIIFYKHNANSVLILKTRHPCCEICHAWVEEMFFQSSRKET